MANQKIKTLSTSALKSIHSKNYTEKKVIIDVEGQNFEVLIQNKFKLSSLQNVIFDLIEARKHLMTINEVFDYSTLTFFYIIKHFTNIQLAKELDSIEKEIQMLNIMLDLGVIEQIFSHFDEVELKKINECIKKMSVNVKKLNNDEDIQKELTELFADIKDEFVDELDEVENIEEIGDIDG